MSYSDIEVAGAARRRLAEIFRIEVDLIKDGDLFGTDLVNSGQSDFAYSELDQVLHDVRDVADRQTTKDIDSGHLVITSVNDYCNHMCRCYRTRESEVVATLGLRNSNA